MMFVPVYAFNLQLHEFVSHLHFYLTTIQSPVTANNETSRVSKTQSLIHRGLVFAVSPDERREPADAIAAQSAFTMQRVVEGRR
jgi:hypothetical protein